MLQPITWFTSFYLSVSDKKLDTRFPIYTWCRLCLWWWWWCRPYRPVFIVVPPVGPIALAGSAPPIIRVFFRPHDRVTTAIRLQCCRQACMHSTKWLSQSVSLDATAFIRVEQHRRSETIKNMSTPPLFVNELIMTVRLDSQEKFFTVLRIFNLACWRERESEREKRENRLCVCEREREKERERIARDDGEKRQWQGNQENLIQPMFR